jgi:hypothetical protein
MFVIIVFAVVILLAGVALMSIQVIVKKNGHFPDTHVGNNKALREKGIHCAKTQDREDIRKKNLFDRLDKGSNRI